MSIHQNRMRRQVREARLQIEAELYKKGYSFRKIQAEVIARLKLERLSLSTIKLDIDKMLKEWRSDRIENIDDAVQIQLEKIDDRNRELWEQWDRSKTNIKKKSNKRKGSPGRGKDDGGNKITTTQIEETETEVIMLGDVAYLSEIRANEAERSKLLGLYAPDKKDISGDLSFAAFLMESGVVEDEKPENES